MKFHFASTEKHKRQASGLPPLRISEDLTLVKKQKMLP